jgi:hypothetical protein
MVILVGPSNFCVWDVWIDFLHMVFCRSTLEQRVARPRRYGFCIALFLRRRSSEAPSAQRRSRRVAVTISAGHESRRINTPAAPENRSIWLSRELPFGTGSLGSEMGRLNFSWHLLPKNARQRHLRNRRWEVESPSAKVAQPDKFRCSGVPFRQAMALHLEPKFKFIIGAEDSEDLRLRLGF